MNWKKAVLFIFLIIVGITLFGILLSYSLWNKPENIQELRPISTEVLEQTIEQVKGQIRSSGEKLYLPNKVTLYKEKGELIVLGIQNTKNIPLKFTMQVDAGQLSDITFTFDESLQILYPLEANVYTIITKTDGEAGVFPVTLKVIDHESPQTIYIEKQFLIEVLE